MRLDPTEVELEPSTSSIAMTDGMIIARVNGGTAKAIGPNLRSPLDARTALYLHFEALWPGASESGR